MKEYLLVGLGGMLGSMSRYFTSSLFAHALPAAKFPWGTFTVNLVGCLLIGVFAGFSERAFQYNSELRLLAITGFLGGFTTFSAFGIESLHLFRAGDLMLAALYVAGSVALGIVCAHMGMKLVS